jgi:hypothetical protein
MIERQRTVEQKTGDHYMVAHAMVLVTYRRQGIDTWWPCHDLGNCPVDPGNCPATVIPVTIKNNIYYRL